MSMLLRSPWGGTYFYPIRSERYLSWKIRVSLSNPRSTRSNIPEKLSSKHEIEAISLVKEEAPNPEGDDEKQTRISIWIVFPIYAVYYEWYNVCINDSILLICMLWVSSPWCYTTLHCYLSRMKPRCWHIGLSAQSQWCHGRDGRNLEIFHEIWVNVVLDK